MKVVINGHRYIIGQLGSAGVQVIQFVDRGHGRDTAGIQCQDLLRVLIDRIQVLDAELPWPRNAEIIYHLRRALLLFEIRALERKLKKGELKPEEAWVDPSDGHWRLR